MILKSQPYPTPRRFQRPRQPLLASDEEEIRKNDPRNQAQEIKNMRSDVSDNSIHPQFLTFFFDILGNDIIHDLLKVSEADLFHQANTVDSDVKLIIQGQERNTKLGLLSPLHRFATFANLAAHYDSDFAPKNAGVYYNYEYFQLYLAYRDLEMERSMQQHQHQQQQQQQSDPSASSPSDSTGLSAIGPNLTAGVSPSSVSRPVMMQCRADIEKVLVNTNWEAIRRRLTIGERICQVCGILGRGYLLLSKQVSGRKLLHNFNTGEWGEFLREFQRPETQTLLQNLQTKLSPERLYQQQYHPHQHHAYTQFLSTSLPTVADTAATIKALPLLPNSSNPSLEAQGSSVPSNGQDTSGAAKTTTGARQAPLVIPHGSNSPTSSPSPVHAHPDSTTSSSGLDNPAPSDNTHTPMEKSDPSIENDSSTTEEGQRKKPKLADNDLN